MAPAGHAAEAPAAGVGGRWAAACGRCDRLLLLCPLGSPARPAELTPPCCPPPTLLLLPPACSAAFKAVDADAQRRWPDRGGTTATLAVACGWELVVANVGDSCAYLDTGSEVLQVGLSCSGMRLGSCGWSHAALAGGAALGLRSVFCALLVQCRRVAGCRAAAAAAQVSTAPATLPLCPPPPLSHLNAGQRHAPAGGQSGGGGAVQGGGVRDRSFQRRRQARGAHPVRAQATPHAAAKMLLGQAVPPLACKHGTGAGRAVCFSAAEAPNCPVLPLYAAPQRVARRPQHGAHHWRRGGGGGGDGRARGTLLLHWGPAWRGGGLQACTWLACWHGGSCILFPWSALQTDGRLTVVLLCLLRLLRCAGLPGHAAGHGRPPAHRLRRPVGRDTPQDCG